MHRLREHGLRAASLPVEFDVDEPRDLALVGKCLRQAAPGTLRYLREFWNSAANWSISVIVPIKNEAQRLPAILQDLTSRPEICEVIVVDGGSTDESVTIARTFTGVRVLSSEPGRGRQLHTGAQQAVGGVLLFVHADTVLPRDAIAQIQGALRRDDFVAGAFCLRTVYDQAAVKRPWVRPFLRLADLRSRYTRHPYGDQALFLRAGTYRAVGGYPEMPLLEDLALSRSLRRLGPLYRAKGPICVSGRRFQERPFYYLAVMNSFPLLYRLGVPVRHLARFYG